MFRPSLERTLIPTCRSLSLSWSLSLALSLSHSCHVPETETAMNERDLCVLGLPVSIITVESVWSWAPRDRRIVVEFVNSLSVADLFKPVFNIDLDPLLVRLSLLEPPVTGAVTGAGTGYRTREPERPRAERDWLDITSVHIYPQSRRQGARPVRLDVLVRRELQRVITLLISKRVRECGTAAALNYVGPHLDTGDM